MPSGLFQWDSFSVQGHGKNGAATIATRGEDVIPNEGPFRADAAAFNRPVILSDHRKRVTKACHSERPTGAKNPDGIGRVQSASSLWILHSASLRSE
jgi:hypothetical protein